MTIDMHAHWRPLEMVDAFCNLDTLPKVDTNSDGIELLNDGRWNKSIDEAFDNVDERIAHRRRLRNLATSLKPIYADNALKLLLDRFRGVRS